MSITGSGRPRDPAQWPDAGSKLDNVCELCDREVQPAKGLAILPVVPTVVPISLRGTSAELKQLDARYTSSDLKAHWYVLRTLPQGYLYVLKPNLTWDAYTVDGLGLLRRMPSADMPAEASAQVRASGGDHLSAQVIVIDPEKHAAVWLAFSRYRWTKAVLANYAANKGNCRDKRMVKLDVMAAAAGSLGSNHKAQNAVRFGAPMGANVGTVVADYASVATVSELNKHLLTPLRARGSQGAPLAARMEEISKSTGGKTGAVIALQDDLGLAIELNALRNDETGRMGTYVAEHQRERMVGDIILGFEESFKQNGQAEEWKTRYAKHYDGIKLLTDKKTYDTNIADWDKRIDLMSDDVATLNGSDSLKAWWLDFDPADDQSAMDRQDATARCLHGAIKTKAERALWDKWLNEHPADAQATLWGAITALDANFGEFMFGKSLPDVGQTDKLVDISKNLLEAVSKFREHLKKRTEQHALSLIGSTMASQVLRLKRSNPGLYKVAGVRVLMAVSVRTTVTVAPGFMSLSQTEEAWLLAEAAFGPPEPSLKRLVDSEMTSGRRIYVVGSNGVDIFAMPGTSTTTTKRRVVELWLPEQLARKVPALPAPETRLALPPPVNPYREMVNFTRTLSGALTWAGLTLQALNLGNSAQSLADSGVSDKSDAYFGVASGILGVLGVTAEIVAETIAKKMGPMFVGRLALLGGALGTASALTEGVQSLVKGNERARAGDDDAALSYRVSSGFMIASGLAGMAAALAVASGKGVLVGTLGLLAPIGASAATVPVAGWIAAGVIFLGIGIAFLWQALKDTDNDIEVWLRGSFYGRGDAKLTVQGEMDGLNKVMYSTAMKIEVEWSDDAWEWRNTTDHDDFDNFRFSIGLPGAGSESVLDCKVTLIGAAGRKEILHETIRPRNMGGRMVDPRGPVVSANGSGRSPRATPPFVWWAPPAISSGASGLSYGGQLKLDDAQFHSAEVEVRYWPNAQTMPNFVLPKEVEKRTAVASD
ncbi:hypothetical protein NR798_47265 [Archangium gephyra]|uniref:T6SS effector BTH_I2691 family protein n=1 Tax=Archangium gephyra TaxID=48 RepID=UPI0035D5043F